MRPLDCKGGNSSSFLPRLCACVVQLNCARPVLQNLAGLLRLKPVRPAIDRGQLILPNGDGESVSLGSGYNDNAYWRYRNTESGISPRAVPGVPGHIFVAATDEHDEDGTLISDEFTNPHKRQMMVEKRARKMQAALALLRMMDPDLEAEGEMHGDAALDEEVRLRAFPNSRLKGEANLLIMPTLDAANIAFNLLKASVGSGVTLGPVLLGVAKPAHILTPSATVRRIVNMTALTVVDANVQRQAQLI